MLYSYELVLGTYSKRTLAPIGMAAISAVLTIWLLTGQGKPFDLPLGPTVHWSDYPIGLLIGCIGAFVGIALMLLVSGVERALKHLVKDETARRLAAGLLLTLLSVRFPAVLGSGHAGIEHAVNGGISGRALSLWSARRLWHRRRAWGRASAAACSALRC